MDGYPAAGKYHHQGNQREPDKTNLHDVILRTGKYPGRELVSRGAQGAVWVYSGRRSGKCLSINCTACEGIPTGSESISHRTDGAFGNVRVRLRMSA